MCTKKGLSYLYQGLLWIGHVVNVLTFEFKGIICALGEKRCSAVEESAGFFDSGTKKRPRYLFSSKFNAFLVERKNIFRIDFIQQIADALEKVCN